MTKDVASVIFGSGGGPARGDKKLTQSELKDFQNEGSKRSKNIEKGGQQD